MADRPAPRPQRPPRSRQPGPGALAPPCPACRPAPERPAIGKAPSARSASQRKGMRQLRPTARPGGGLPGRPPAPAQSLRRGGLSARGGHGPACAGRGPWAQRRGQRRPGLRRPDRGLPPLLPTRPQARQRAPGECEKATSKGKGRRWATRRPRAGCAHGLDHPAEPEPAQGEVVHGHAQRGVEAAQLRRSASLAKASRAPSRSPMSISVLPRLLEAAARMSVSSPPREAQGLVEGGLAAVSSWCWESTARWCYRADPGVIPACVGLVDLGAGAAG